MEDDMVYTLRAKRGDSEAFGILYDRYVEKIYRFIYYKTFVKETAEDLTSDVFHKAFAKIHAYHERKGSFSAWLYRIARNTVIDHYRTERKTVPIDDVFDLGDDDRTEAEHDIMLTYVKVSEYLKALNPRQREIITLRIWEGMSYREIAETIGGTEDSVKMAFSRGMKELREKCGDLAPLVCFLIGITAALPFADLS